METIVKGLRDEFTTLQDQYKTEIDSMVELVDLHKQNRLDAEEENSKLYNYAKELQIEYLDLDNYYKNLLKTESRRHKDLQSINLSLKAKYSSLKEKNNELIKVRRFSRMIFYILNFVFLYRSLSKKK